MSDEGTIVPVDGDGGAQDDRIQLIEVKNLIVSPAPMRRIALADIDSLERAVRDPGNDVKAIIWNEYEVALLTRDGMDMRFRPVFDRSTTVFFEKDDTRHRGGWGDPDSGKRIWEGEFAPVIFSKTSLLKYLRQYSECFDEGIREAVRELKVKASVSSKEVMLDDLGEAQKNVEEVTSKTNIPRTFTADLPLFDGIQARVEFEASVKKKDGKTLIELRCTNAKDALRATMKQVLERIPPGLPAYYGSMEVQTGEKR